MLSEKLMIERAGNFTASQNHRLMAGWDAPKLKTPSLIAFEKEFVKMKSRPLVGAFKKEFDVDVSGADINEMWAWTKQQEPPTGLVTYAEEKALETLFDYDPSLNFSTVHTRNGDEREAECMALLSEKTQIDFLHTGDDQIHIHANEVGCTPDGVVKDEFDLVATGAEAKCKSPLEHARLWLINTAAELKENAFDHFVQIQTQMLVTGADHWYFAIYNPYAKDDWMRFKYIVIGRDDGFIKILQSRIDWAKQIKADFLKQFTAEKQKAA